MSNYLCLNAAKLQAFQPAECSAATNGEPSMAETSNTQTICCKDSKNFENSQIFVLQNFLKKENKEAARQRAEAATPKMLPIDGLPPMVQGIIKEYAEGLQAHRDIVAVAALIAIGTAAGRRKTILFDNYRNTPCLWACVVAPSGSNKSTPISKMLEPLKAIDSRNMKKFESEKDAWLAGGSVGQEPKFQQTIITDITPEARMEALHNNDGLLQYNDEFSTFLENIGRYTPSGELSQLLSIYDNDKITINRKSEDPMSIEHPFLNLLGTIQPGVVPQKFAKLVENGFVARMQFVCLPELKAQPYNGRTISEEAKRQWSDFIERIHADETTATLTCTEEARNCLIATYNENVERINSLPDDDDHMRSVISKQSKLIERLALITAIAHDSMMVELQHVKYAVSVARYFEDNAKRILELICPQTGGKVAKTTQKEHLEWLFETFPVAKSNIPQLSDCLGVAKNILYKYAHLSQSREA